MIRNEKLETALKRIQVFHPFFYFMCAELRICESMDFDTMATDGENLYFNPEYVAKLSTSEVEAVLLHEIHHVVFLHPWLSEKALLEGRNRVVWDLAMEFVVNDAVQKIIEQRSAMSGDTKKNDQTPKLPGNPMTLSRLLKYLGVPDSSENIYLHDKHFDNMDVFSVYEILMKKIKTQLIKIQLQNRVPQPNTAQTGRSWIINEHQLERLIEKHLHGNEEAARKVRERFLLAPTVFGETWKSIYGSFSETLRRQYDELSKPEVNWKRYLSTIAGRILDTDEFRWDTPNVRHPLAREVIYPGLRSEKIDDVFIAIDTSGSINDRILSQFLGECGAILKYLERVGIMTIDCIEQPIQYVLPGELKDLDIRGGGGTDFSPAFRVLAEQKITPALLVYFTDAFGRFPQTAPSFPVLWVLTSHSGEVPEGYGRVAYFSSV